MSDRSDRASKALELVNAFYGRGDDDLLHERVTDLLADLRHFCHENDIDFINVDNMAQQHFDEELAEDNDATGAK